MVPDHEQKFTFLSWFEYYLMRMSNVHNTSTIQLPCRQGFYPVHHRYSLREKNINLIFYLSWSVYWCQRQFLREAVNCEKKDFLWNHFVNGGGGSDWFHTSILFFQTPSKHTSNTLQHPSNTLKTPINTLQTTFKIISFFAQKMVGKKSK